jgi:hypothetical protein
MAISFVSPSGEVSIQDDLWHIATSSNSGQTDFKYVYDVYYNGQQLIRSKVFSDPLNGKGYFNASQVVRNEITFDWFQPVANNSKSFINQPSISGQIGLTYQVSVGEDFSGITTLNLASGNTTAYNYIPSVFKRRQQTLISNNWYSNRPKIINAKITDKILIGYKGTGTLNLYFEAYGENNNLLSSGYGNNTYSSNGYVQMDIGASAINQTIGSNDINSFVKYYKVRIENGINSSFIQVNLLCNNKYDSINLHFMNAWGMFDTASFNLVSKLSMDLERKTYSKRDYSFNGNSVKYYDSNNVYNESSINYGSKIDWKYKLTMNYPTDAEYQWLNELIISPQIYAEIDGAFYPVSIINTNYEYSKNVNNGLRAFEIDIAMNQTRYGYRR